LVGTTDTGHLWYEPHQDRQGIRRLVGIRMLT
jgi:hypothetical protein